MSIQSIIRGAPLFNDLYDSEIDSILQSCHVMQLQTGEKIFNEGDAGEDLYLVLNGKIDIMKKGVLIASLGKAEIFGEMILLYEGTRSTDAFAVVPSDLLLLNYQAILSVYDKNPRAMSIMMLNLSRLLADRLKKSNVEVRDLRLTCNELISQLMTK
jgi:CRP/FNR family cyclic AMP-dependent transcriptional regulator